MINADGRRTARRHVHLRDNTGKVGDVQLVTFYITTTSTFRRLSDSPAGRNLHVRDGAGGACRCAARCQHHLHSDVGEARGAQLSIYITFAATLAMLPVCSSATSVSPQQCLGCLCSIRGPLQADTMALNGHFHPITSRRHRSTTGTHPDFIFIYVATGEGTPMVSSLPIQIWHQDVSIGALDIQAAGLPDQVEDVDEHVRRVPEFTHHVQVHSEEAWA